MLPPYSRRVAPHATRGRYRLRGVFVNLDRSGYAANDAARSRLEEVSDCVGGLLAVLDGSIGWRRGVQDQFIRLVGGEFVRRLIGLCLHHPPFPPTSSTGATTDCRRGVFGSGNGDRGRAKSTRNHLRSPIRHRRSGTIHSPNRHPPQPPELGVAENVAGL